MCGLFGFINYGEPQPGKLLNVLCNSLSMESEIRGSHATGISFVERSRLNILKQPKRASLLDFKIPKDTVALMGHTRHATQGSQKKNDNNHPFSGKIRKQEFSLAHNGVIINDSELRAQLKLPKTKIETDSYICVQLLESNNGLDFGSIRYMAENILGSFTITILDRANNLYIVKGNSPMSVINFKELGILVYASTDSILWRAMIETHLMDAIKKNLNSRCSDAIEIVGIEAGEILKVSRKGKIDRSNFKYSDDGLLLNWRTYRSYNDDCLATEDNMSALIELGDLVGVDENEIRAMIDEGFHVSEIEEMINSYYYDDCGGFGVNTLNEGGYPNE